MKTTICLFHLIVVIILNKDSLNDLFKPYELDFVEFEDLYNATGLNESDVLEIVMECECSKSKNESCINQHCDFNLVGEHSSEIYKRIINGGDLDAKECD